MFVVPPDADTSRPTLVEVVPVEVLLNRPAYVVCVEVAFAPLVATLNAVLVLLAAAVPVAAIFTTRPDETDEDENSKALPVVRLFAVAFNPAVLPLPVVTVAAIASNVPSDENVLIPPKLPLELY